MGKPTGFLEYERETSTAVSPLERIKNFNEFHTPLSQEEQQIQAARCMECGVPFCQAGMMLPGGASGCPLNNLVPEWNDLIYNGNWEEAYYRLIKTNNFPEFTSRVCPALCEAACYYNSKGKTLWDAMIDIYEKYGYYEEAQVSIVKEGPEGAQAIKDMMTKMRNSDIKKIGEYNVIKFKDIEKDIIKDVKTGEITKTGLPKSNVVYYELEDDNWCCIRPSGTEPKIKLYMGVKGSSDEEAAKKLEELKEAMLEIVKI